MKKIWAVNTREEKNTAAAFACRIRNSKERLCLRIAAENRYRLWINGELQGYGPVRAAKGFTRIAEYEIGNKTLPQGDVIVVAEVWGYNVNTYCSVMDLPFFAAEITDGISVLYSTEQGDFLAFDMTDRKRVVQRYSFQRGFTENYRMERDRHGFYNGDFSLFPQLQTEEVFGCELIAGAQPTHSFPEISGSLKSRGNVEIREPKEHFEAVQLVPVPDRFYCFAPEEIEDKVHDDLDTFDFEENRQGENPYYLYDFGRNITGFVHIKIRVIKKTTLYFMFDEILVEGKNQINCRRDMNSNVVKWALSEGEYDLLTFEPYTMRYAYAVLIDGEAVLKHVGIRLFQNEKIRLSARISDRELQEIFEAGVHSFEQNDYDIPMDCPSRERAGWLCDSLFTSRAEQLLTGENQAEKNFLENYIMAPQDKNLPEGMIPMCYPADHTDHVFIANYGCWFIIELYDYGKRSGDEQLLLNAKSKVLGILEFFKKYRNKEGLIERMDSWIFVEWSEAAKFIQDVNVPSNFLYAYALECSGKMYHLEDLREQSEYVRSQLRNLAWNGEFFVDHLIRADENGKPLYPAAAERENKYCDMPQRFQGKLVPEKDITETCQYYALTFGKLEEREEFQPFIKRMYEYFGPLRDVKKVYPQVYPSNAFIGDFLRLSYFSSQGFSKKMLAECKDYFLKMAKKTGTLWEYDSTFASCNHGFTSYIVNLILRELIGLVEVDSKKKTAYFTNGKFDIDCTVKLPVADGMVVISVKDGKREINSEGVSIK